MKCLVNATSHPSRWWSARQRAMALRVCGADFIVDEPFPRVPEESAAIGTIVYKFVKCILAHNPVSAVVQGHPLVAKDTAYKLQEKGVFVAEAKGRRLGDTFIVDSIVAYK